MSDIMLNGYNFALIFVIIQKFRNEWYSEKWVLFRGHAAKRSALCPLWPTCPYRE